MQESKDVSILDLNNLDDLLPEIRIMLSKKESLINSTILSLFEIKKELSLDEIIVGLSRMGCIPKSRPWLANKVSILKRKGILRKSKVNKKLYTKTKEI